MRLVALCLLTLCFGTGPAHADAWDDCEAALGLEERLEKCALVTFSTVFSAETRAAAHVNRGAAYSSLRRPELALREYNAALALRPNYALAIYNRGRVYRALGDLEQSLQDFDAALAATPNFPRALNESCWTRVILGRDWDNAARICDAAVAAAPTDPDALDTRALLQLRRGQFAAALVDYDAALRYATGHFDHFRYGRGVALLRLGREAEGRAEIEAALAINPGIAAQYAEWGVAP